MPPFLQVKNVGLVVVGFTLERYVSVCVAFHKQPNNPFGHIPQIEEHVEHFLHLGGMYALVIENNIVDDSVLSHEQDAHQIDGTKAFDWNDVVSDDNHTCQGLRYGSYDVWNVAICHSVTGSLERSSLRGI